DRARQPETIMVAAPAQRREAGRLALVGVPASAKIVTGHLSSSNFGRAQGRFELAKVFGHFGPPGHLLSWALWVFQGQHFGVQGLARKGDVSLGTSGAGGF